MAVDDGKLAHELQMSQARANNGAAELGAALSSLLQLDGPRGRARRVPYTKHELLSGPQVKRAIRGLVDDYKSVAARERQLTERVGGLCKGEPHGLPASWPACPALPLLAPLPSEKESACARLRNGEPHGG